MATYGRSFSVRMLHDIILYPHIYSVFECQIILCDYFLGSQLLSTNNPGHDGTLENRLTEMNEDIKLLIVL